MAQTHGRTHYEVPVSAVGVVVEVGAAQSGAFDGDLDFVGLGGGIGAGFLVD